MILRIKPLIGEVKVVEIQPTDQIQTVKEKLREVEGTAVDQQRLIYQGKFLKDQKTVESYHLKNGAMLQMVKALRNSIYKNWLYQRYLSLAVPQEITYLLENLRKNYRIALITNGTSAAQWEKIDRLDLKSCFDLILVSGDLPHEKPNKNIFLQACDHLNIKPKNCLMVGDKLETDIQGGLEAGLAGTVWVPLGAHYNLAETDPQPNFILRNIMELKYLLSNAKEFEIRLMARRLKKSSLSSPSSSAYEAQSSCSRSTISNGHLLNNDRKSSRSSKQLYWTKLMAFRPEEDSNSNASDGS